jgi:2-methylcitrate dehydratase PrpD
VANETVRLAEYAAGLRYDDLPDPVVQRAKDCIADTAATIIYGRTLPWSRIIVAYAQRSGAAGRSRILGTDGPALQPAAAALANGALAHAFELDNLTKPGAGVHPGATLLPPALAAAQQHGGSGRDLIAAVVAGFEVMYRIGYATKHSNEVRGFHAPGTTGPFGGAIAAGRILHLDPQRMTNALGIAGSLAGGLMEFARSRTGGMVKRLHLGRASESGVLAAALAADGFEGPTTVLEGELGFFRVFCNEFDLTDLTSGLGRDFAMLNLCLKRYACHITAHTPVQAVLELKAEHGFDAAEVSRVTVAGTERMATINNIPAPADIMMAQYSIPFCVALALVRDPRDPASFDSGAVADPQIRALCARVEMQVADPAPPKNSWASVVTITLRDGRSFTRGVESFNGTPERPLSRSELHDKFVTLTRDRYGAQAGALFDRIQALEGETELTWLGVPPA